jgi:4-hydroxybenzoate polyprenyltransferase
MTTAAATGSRPSALMAWLRLMRVSNAPTVVTNAMVGMAIAMRSCTDPSLAVKPAITAATGCVLIYLAGMMMNDYFDQPIDRRERPGRPIVSGAVSESNAIVVAMGLLASGVVSLSWTGTRTIPWMLLLVSSVLAYNMMHRSMLVGPVLMATCRAMVPTIVAIAAAPGQQPHWPLLAFFALPLAGCTLAISLAARHEVGPQTPASAGGAALSMAAAVMGAAAVMPLGAVALALLAPTGGLRLALYGCGVLTAAWWVVRGMFDLVQPNRGPRGVMAWIATLGMIDAASLILLGHLRLAVIAAGCALLTRLMQRLVAGS